jgi:hypothetical protein
MVVTWTGPQTDWPIRRVLRPVRGGMTVRGTSRSAIASRRRATRPMSLPADTAMAVGAGLIAWSSGIHLDLWHAGYRTIPTIGSLFLFQAVTGFALAAAIAATRGLYPALAGAAFLASTIGGFVWSVEWGLFGFQDGAGSPFAVESLVVESAGTLVLVLACVLRRRFVRARPSVRCPAEP